MLLSNSQNSPWERPLLELAYEAFQRGSGTVPRLLSRTGAANPEDLERAYRSCSRLTADNSRSFYLASLFLPADKRRSMHALYAFCRIADDIVDHPGADPRRALSEWRRITLVGTPSSEHPVALAWADTRQRYRIPLRLAEQLLEGVEGDLQPARYQTFDELASYAYRVASTVGLMSMHITGFSSRQAIPYAVKLGVALQLTNILRDIGEDWRAGRVYLPAEELDRFGVCPNDLPGTPFDHRWRSFMRFQIHRNRTLYAEAWPGIALLHPDGRMAIAAAADFYQAILDDIEAHDYDVFSRRAHLSAWGKLRRLPGLWQRLHSNRDATSNKIARGGRLAKGNTA